MRNEASNRFQLFRNRLSASAAIAILASAVSAPAADILLESFEIGGFDEPGDADVTTTPFQTIGVTNGSFSLKVDSTNTSFWTDYGHVQVANPADVFAQTHLKWDVTTPNGLQIIPIFLTDVVGQEFIQGPVVSVAGGASPQTMFWDYSAIGLPTTATNIRVRFQGNNGQPVSFHMDNVRVGAVAAFTNANATWTRNGSGDWADGTNWNPSIPGLPGSQANFNTNGGLITTPNQIVVNLDQPATVVNMNFDKGGGGYRINSTAKINVAANINVASGNHIVAAPVELANAGIMNVAASSSLTLHNLSGGGFGLFQKEGAGALTTDKVVNVSVQVNGGSWNLAPGNAQANGFIYDILVANGSTFNIGNAQVRNNSLSTGSGGGTLVIGAGGLLQTGLYGGSEVFFGITGAGNVQIGGEGPVDTVTFSGPNNYSGSTTVTTGDSLVVNTSLGTGALNASNGTVTFTQGNALTQKVASVSAGANSAVDLNDNDMIVTASNYAAVRTLIASARNGGAWDGTGLTSTTARNAVPKITNLGAITGAQFHAAAGAGALFNGHAVANTDVLVKYTYNGDTDLNGVVNFDDYSRTDSGFNSGGTTWFAGDFDYNGIVNFDDYSLIDAAFNQQGGTILRMLSFLDGSDRDRSDMTSPELAIVVKHFDMFGEAYATAALNSVPEPTSALVFSGLAALAARSRRRRVN